MCRLSTNFSVSREIKPFRHGGKSSNPNLRITTSNTDMSQHWKAADIPSLTGKRVIITGANSGIGYHAALKLARKGANVVLASRDRQRGEAALARLHADSPGTHTELAILDLASLASVREFAEKELAQHRPLDILINNAGVMAPPRRLQTTDGFELQFGTNVLGHFVLTALLMPALEEAATASADRPRIVTLASITHKRGHLNFDDLQSTKSYSPMRAYQQSKLADLMFAFELDRRLRAIDSRVMSVAAHPGVANTNLFQVGDYSPFQKTLRNLFGHAIGIFLNSDSEGALPTLYAATASAVEDGGYYGPQGFQEMRGDDVAPAIVAPQARDISAAIRLWEICEDLTGVKFLPPVGNHSRWTDAPGVTQPNQTHRR
jgi:NAD(P)-dependent dehydrogenase (short-subunit alcohol dehydrogenase family)